MRTLVVPLTALVVLTLALPGQAQRRHRARPAIPAVMVNPDQCNMFIDARVRGRCKHCVTHNGRFHTGPRRCERMAPPPPPPPPPVLTAEGQCNAHLRHPGKRGRCRHCVRRGGRFHIAGPGNCEMPPPPPPPPRVLDTPRQCDALLRHPGKRGRCHHCVTHNGRFHTDGAAPGHCERRAPPPPPPPPPVFTNKHQCRRHIDEPGRRRACRHCVRRGGRFHVGSGDCEMPGPPQARNIDECNANAHPFPKRRRCHRCVRRGGVFFLAGPGRCNMPPPPPPRPDVIRSIPECNHRLPHHRRHHCRKCIKRGGVFRMDGTCHM